MRTEGVERCEEEEVDGAEEVSGWTGAEEAEEGKGKEGEEDEEEGKSECECEGDAKEEDGEESGGGWEEWEKEEEEGSVGSYDEGGQHPTSMKPSNETSTDSSPPR